MTTTHDPAETSDREMVATRSFKAPRSLVWKAWTQPEHISKWWGPRGFTSTIQQMDVSPGGEWRLVMHGPDGTDYPNHITYQEVVEPERLVYMHHAIREGEPYHFISTVTFSESDGGTEVTMRLKFPSTESLANAKKRGAVEGQQQTIDRLGEHLDKMMEDQIADRKDSESEFVISRVFNAPRGLVFKAWTEEERLKRWWGPKGFSVTHCKVDLRPGGVFHYAIQSQAGQEMWGKWVYREIAEPERLVYTSSFSDSEGNIAPAPFSPDWPLEILNTLTLDEHEGGTKLTLSGGAINATDAQRKFYEGMFSSMEQGFGGTFNQLDEYLAQEQGKA